MNKKLYNYKLKCNIENEVEICQREIAGNLSKFLKII